MVHCLDRTHRLHRHGHLGRRDHHRGNRHQGVAHPRRAASVRRHRYRGNHHRHHRDGHHRHDRHGRRGHLDRQSGRRRHGHHQLHLGRGAGQGGWTSCQGLALAACCRVSAAVRVLPGDHSTGRRYYVHRQLGVEQGRCCPLRTGCSLGVVRVALALALAALVDAVSRSERVGMPELLLQQQAAWLAVSALVLVEGLALLLAISLVQRLARPLGSALLEWALAPAPEQALRSWPVLLQEQYLL